MRDILFRGKRIEDGQWVEGHYHFANWYLPPSMEIVDRTHHILQIGRGDADKIDPDTLGQFTGLNDKNDQKIFEGDIVEIIHQGIYQCRWDEGNFEFGFVNEKESFGVAYISPNDIVVIGNIYDNPELLENP